MINPKIPTRTNAPITATIITQNGNEVLELVTLLLSLCCWSPAPGTTVTGPVVPEKVVDAELPTVLVPEEGRLEVVRVLTSVVEEGMVGVGFAEEEGTVFEVVPELGAVVVAVAMGAVVELCTEEVVAGLWETVVPVV